MPIYEFYSPQTNKIYSFFARSLDYSDSIPMCPHGKQFEMKKLISGFSITGKREESSEGDKDEDIDPNDPFSGMTAEQSGLMMKELEGAMQGMDEENPDPKQMGSLMRRMCELSGQEMDEPMQEVVRKLEEGSDPDELEDRMGDYMNDSEPGESVSEPEEHCESALKMRKLRNYFNKRILRDPELYEFEKFVT